MKKKTTLETITHTDVRGKVSYYLKVTEGERSTIETIGKKALENIENVLEPKAQLTIETEQPK